MFCPLITISNLCGFRRLCSVVVPLFRAPSLKDILFCNGKYKYNKKSQGKRVSTPQSSAYGGEIGHSQLLRVASSEGPAPSEESAGTSKVQAWLCRAAPQGLPRRNPPPGPPGTELTSSSPGVTPHSIPKAAAFTTLQLTRHPSWQGHLPGGANVCVCIFPKCTLATQAQIHKSGSSVPLTPQPPWTPCADLSFNTFC